MCCSLTLDDAQETGLEITSQPQYGQFKAISPCIFLLITIDQLSVSILLTESYFLLIL